MTPLLIDHATLEQLVVALEEVLDYINRYSIPAHQLELDPIDESIKTLNAALANAERAEPDTQLCKFYDVATYPDLVAAMEKHITKLQARTPPLTGEAFTQKPRFA